MKQRQTSAATRPSHRSTRLLLYIVCIASLVIAAAVGLAVVPATTPAPKPIASHRQVIAPGAASTHHTVATGYQWIAGASASYDFKTALHMKFAEVASSRANDQAPLIDLKVAGKYHLHVLEVLPREVRIAALLEPTSITNADEPIAEVLPVLSKTIGLISLNLDGSLRDLRFPQGTREDRVMLLRAVFGWQFAIESGSTKWSRDEHDDVGTIRADYGVQSNAKTAIKTRHAALSSATGPAARIQHSTFTGIVGKVWLDSLHGSEHQEMLNESVVFASASMSIDLELIDSAIPDALLHVDPNTFVVIRSAKTDDTTRLRQIPLSTVLNRLAQCSGPGRALADYNEAGHAFQKWLEANPEKASQVVEALRSPMSDGQSAFLARALADTAPQEAASLHDHAEEFPSDAVFQTLASLNTSKSIAAMPSSVGESIARVLNSDSADWRERDAALFALGSFAQSHPEWLPRLWSAIAPHMQPDTDATTLSNGFRALANTEANIPAAVKAAIDIGMPHSEPQVRLSAIDYLRSLHDSPEARAALQASATNDPHDNVRAAAATALEPFGQTANPTAASGMAAAGNATK